MRQITGYMEDYWETRGLDIPVPSASQLGERFASLEVSVTQRCEQLARRLARGGTISLIVDSTGLSFGRASQWYEEKYAQKAARTPWRKMHLSIDADMNVHAIRITTTEVSDSEGMDAVLPADVPMDLQHRAYRSAFRRGRDARHPTASSRCRTRRGANPPA
ncbi:transposase [Cupriavidus necator]|nr:transposase [Cupriavidus necator]